MEELKNMTTEQLLQEARDARAYADERYAYFDDCCKELLARHKATGETNLEGDGVQSILTREPLSEAWLKRNYSLAMKDLPPDCITEKITPTIDWEKAGAWMSGNGMPLETTYRVQVKVKPMKKAA